MPLIDYPLESLKDPGISSHVEKVPIFLHPAIEYIKAGVFAHS